MINLYNCRPSGGMADAGDLKSPARKGVWVRLPPRLLAERRGHFYGMDAERNSCALRELAFNDGNDKRVGDIV